ncbi:MAG: glycosyltransferase [Bacteroidales bacterium]|jgi:glycosyltransferase involved in cell wall biosynthesis
MLSVLIPVKDWNPFGLADALADQLARCGHPFEILISDDSPLSESSPLAKLAADRAGITYFCRDNPLGRSANRNFLAKHARYPYLLFIDGDAGVANEDFIRNYLNNLVPNAVLCGGTLYDPQRPENPDHLLRWKYGIEREQCEAGKRMLKPWKSFSTFNFLIPAEIFHMIRFEESIQGYGHEDTLFGIHLHQSGISIIHLDNGLIHLGLEPACHYLDKIRESGENLHRLYTCKLLPEQYIGDINLLLTWKRLKTFGITGLLSVWFTVRRKSIERRLCGPHPSILLLDLYKLGAISHFG